jgi:hypothetical protein
MRAKHRIFIRGIFKEKFRGLILATYFAGEMNRGFYTCQDSPFCGLVLKLAHGANKQVVYDAHGGYGGAEGMPQLFS